MGKLNRRNAIKAGALAVAFPATAQASETVSPEVKAAIEAHRKAEHAFSLAVDDYDNADRAYFGFGQDARKAREIVIPLSMGGGVSLFPEMNMEQAKADAMERAERLFNKLNMAATETAALSPVLYRDTLVAIGEALARDQQTIDGVVEAELAKQTAAGVRKVADQYESASNAERDTFAWLCAVPCMTLADANAKGEYLINCTMMTGGYLEPEFIEALAISLTGRDGSEAK